MTVYSPAKQIITMTLTTTSTFAIAADADDGQDLDGTWDGTGNAWGVGQSAAASLFHGGTRFTGISGIPQGSTIVQALLHVNNFAIQGNGGAVRIYGDDNDTAIAWGDGAGNSPAPADFTETTAFTVPDLSSTGEKFYVVTTSVQEIVNRASWDEATIRFAWQDNGSVAGNHAILLSRESTGLNPELIIEI